MADKIPDTPRRRGRPKADDSTRLSHVLQLRLNRPQRAYMLLMAEEWQCSIGEAVRRCIDERLDAHAPVDGLEIDGEPATLRQALSLGEPAPDWVAEHVRKFGTR